MQARPTAHPCLHHRSTYCNRQGLLGPTKPRVCCVKRERFKRSYSVNQLDQSQPANPKHLFIFGFGYTTLGLANLLHQQGWRISGTVRTAEKADYLVRCGFDIRVYDAARQVHLDDAGQQALRQATHVITSIPPIALPLYDPVLNSQMKLLKQCGTNLEWFGYLSSTSAYGNYHGE